MIKTELNIYFNGAFYYFRNDLLHNEEGPAVEFADGSKIWCINGKYHRLDGPAREYSNGEKYWYYQDIAVNDVNQQEFKYLTPLVQEEFIKYYRRLVLI